MASKHEALVETLLAEIVDGEAPSGSWLPSEQRLADRFGVSRGTVRQAIAALRQRDMLTVVHGRGQLVLPEAEWNLLDRTVIRMMVTRRSRRDLLRELLECRRVLEGQSVRLAAERSTAHDDEDLARALQDMREAAAVRSAAGPDEHPLVDREVRFHRRLMAAAGNRPLDNMLRPLHLGLAIARQRAVPRQHAVLTAGYEAIVDAVRERDGERARDALIAHVDQLARWLRV